MSRVAAPTWEAKSVQLLPGFRVFCRELAIENHLACSYRYAGVHSLLLQAMKNLCKAIRQELTRGTFFVGTRLRDLGKLPLGDSVSSLVLIADPALMKIRRGVATIKGHENWLGGAVQWRNLPANIRHISIWFPCCLLSRTQLLREMLSQFADCRGACLNLDLHIDSLDTGCCVFLFDMLRHGLRHHNRRLNLRIYIEHGVYHAKGHYWETELAESTFAQYVVLGWHVLKLQESLNVCATWTLYNRILRTPDVLAEIGVVWPEMFNPIPWLCGHCSNDWNNWICFYCSPDWHWPSPPRDTAPAWQRW